VLAVDQSPEMVALAQQRLGDRATVWSTDALALTVPEPVDAIISTATFHWVKDHDALWPRLHQALKPGGQLVVQCGGRGNIASVERIIAAVAPPELKGWSPWTFAGPEETKARLEHAGFTDIQAWLEDKPTDPDDLEEFVRTSILPAHFGRLPAEAREPFARAVLDRVQPPLDYVRLNLTARSS
jgi:trans-aconitate 2-methyltransferase